MLGPVTITPLLDREVYLYGEVDRIIGLRPGTARRWINGYERAHHLYEPILRTAPEATEWVTWGEFVETRILAEYRDQQIPTARLRGAVESLRETFKLKYPLAHLQPYLAAEAGELAIEQRDSNEDRPALMVLRTRQMLLDSRGLEVMRRATLTEDDNGRQIVAELVPDQDFETIVVSPDRQSGQPTFAGRRVSAAVIAGMAKAGESVADLASGYRLSLEQVQQAVEYCARHNLAA
jgi:uncharacterized protein (DUF433 family)